MRAMAIAASADEAGYTPFEVRSGNRRVRCLVADTTLDAASGLSELPTLTLRRRSFEKFRTLIQATAQRMLGELPVGFIGSLVISGEDMRQTTPEQGMAVFGDAGRRNPRP